MQPQLSANILNGICIFPDAYEIKKFNSQNYNQDDWYTYKLSNGRIIDMGGEVLKQVIFDFNGGETYYNGYIKGFIYSNGKFLGKIHYVPTVNKLPESLDGTYNFIDRGIELKGFWYAGTEVWGFFIRLNVTSSSIPKVKNNAIEKKKLITEKKIKAKLNKKKEFPETHKEILTKELLDIITIKAAPIKQKRNAIKFDHYQYIIDLKPQAKDFENVILAMSIAYSWMPTMLDIYINDVKDKKKLVKIIQDLGTIKSLFDFEKKEKLIENYLIYLVDIINHSIVGTSKTVHIFFPRNIPILDSRVLKTWNELFKSKFKKNEKLKLPIHVPLTTQAMVKTYMVYWKCMLCWAHNSQIKDLRQIEEPLYWLGNKITK
jgi:hypothetical protein